MSVYCHLFSNIEAFPPPSSSPRFLPSFPFSFLRKLSLVRCAFFLLRLFIAQAYWESEKLLSLLLSKQPVSEIDIKIMLSLFFIQHHSYVKRSILFRNFTQTRTRTRTNAHFFISHTGTLNSMAKLLVYFWLLVFFFVWALFSHASFLPYICRMNTKIKVCWRKT